MIRVRKAGRVIKQRAHPQINLQKY
jgi:hypothetical protein